MSIKIRDVLVLAEDQVKRAEITAEADVQKYVTDLENEYQKIKASAELEVKNVRETAAAEIHHAEHQLAVAIETKMHEIGKELKQGFDMTKAFVERVFKGLPAHVQPGSVAPYGVDPAPQEVGSLPSETADRSKGVPDITS